MGARNSLHPLAAWTHAIETIRNRLPRRRNSSSNSQQDGVAVKVKKLSLTFGKCPDVD
jgi:hypothetical protein